MATADPTFSAASTARSSSSAIFGRVMGLVALTVAFAAAGVWILAGPRLETADALGVVAAGLEVLP